MQYRECSRRKDIVIHSIISVPLSDEQIVKVTCFMVECLMEDNKSENIQQQEQQLKLELFKMQFIQNQNQEQNQDKDALQVSQSNIQQQLLAETNIQNVEIYITKINTIYTFEDKHHILALIFLKKIQLYQQLELNQNNWQSLITISFILAIEFWDNFTIEHITNTEQFINSEISKYFNKEILTKLRIDFLTLLGIKGAMIKPQLFYKFRQEFLSLADQQSLQAQKQIPISDFEKLSEIFFSTVQKLLE